MSRITQRSFWLLAIALHCLGYAAMQAEWADDFLRWKHRVPITLSNPGAAMTNYFLLLQIDTKAPIDGKKMRADGNDIRIVDAAGKGLKYWVQDGVGTSATNIWVKVPSLPAGNSTIYMYYGNTSADAPTVPADVFGNRIMALYSFTEGKDTILHDWVGGRDLKLENLQWVQGFRNGLWALDGFASGFAYTINLGSGPPVGDGSFTVLAGITPRHGHGGGQFDIVGSYHGDLTSPGWVMGLKQGILENASLMMATHDIQDGYCEGDPGGDFVPDVWALAAGKRETGVGKKVYHNGAVVGQTCPGDTRDVNGTSTFGIGNVNGVNAFEGIISFVAIYDTAYSDAAVAELHKSIFPGADPAIMPSPEETLPPPNITQQPMAITPCLGASATLSVTATGPQLRYQWRKNGQDIPGATGSTYTIASTTLADNGTYDVVIRYYTVSKTAQITILTPPEIQTQPTAQSVCPGTPAKFSVVGSGPGLTYQWRKDGIAIPGATSATFVIASTSPADAGSYDVVVSGPCDPPATSATAALTLNATPAITEQPASKSACRGDFVTFNVAATGTDITYQWRKNGVAINGATGPQLGVAVEWQSQGAYDVVVSGRCQPAATSQPAQLTVLFEPIISEEPASQIAKPGGSVVFSVKANAGGTLSYQWYKNGLDMPGRIYDTLMLNNVSVADIADYHVVISGTDCPQKLTTSASAQFYLDVPPTIVTQPESITGCQAKSATLSVTAAGAGLSYQWRKNGANIRGAISRTLSLSNLSPSDAGSYDVIITSATGQTLTSSPATVTVLASATITTQPADMTICPDESVSLTVGATGSGLSYQWRRNGVNIAGATGATFSIAEATAADSGAYTVVVRDSCANTVTSSIAHVRLNQPPAISEQPTGASVDQGQSVVLSVKATGTGLGYQWRKDAANISGATAATYTITNAQPQDAGMYDVVVTGACTPAATSTQATLTVRTLSVIASGPAESGAMLLVRPHPAHGPTRLTITLPQGVHAGSGTALILHDMHGAAVMDLSESFARSGYRTAELDASLLASGVYYCRLSTQSWNGTLGSIVVEK